MRKVHTRKRQTSWYKSRLFENRSLEPRESTKVGESFWQLSRSTPISRIRTERFVERTVEPSIGIRHGGSLEDLRKA